MKYTFEQLDIKEGRFVFKKIEGLCMIIREYNIDGPVDCKYSVLNLTCGQIITSWKDKEAMAAYLTSNGWEPLHRPYTLHFNVMEG